MALDEIAKQVEEKRSKEEAKSAVPAHTIFHSLTFDQLMMIGMVASIVILSIAVVVYAARH